MFQHGAQCFIFHKINKLSQHALLGGKAQDHYYFPLLNTEVY